MYARITKYRMKPESLDAATALVKALKPKIMGMPGMIEFINVVDKDGNGYVVSLVESQETSDANQGTVAALWGQFADLLAGPVESSGHDVIMHERA